MKVRLPGIVSSGLLVMLFLLLTGAGIYARKGVPEFKVVAFYTGENDRAHVSFVREANLWFNETSGKYRFSYVSTNNWDNLNIDYLAKYDIVIFLDSRPEKMEQRIAFEQYMKRGGAWIGFHFAAFALTPSD